MSTRSSNTRGPNTRGIADSFGPGSQFRHRLGGHLPERDALAVAPQVCHRHILQGRQHMAARPQSPRQRMAGAAFYEVAPSADDAGLGAAKELVA